MTWNHHNINIYYIYVFVDGKTFLFRTSSNRFCKSGIDFVITAVAIPLVLGVGVVAAVAPLPDAVVDPAADGDNDELAAAIA